MSFSPRLFSRKKSSTKRIDGGERTTTSISSDATGETESATGEILLHDHVNILSESNLNKLWNDLKGGMKYNAIKSIKLSFSIEPTRDISKMKHLDDVFGALGGLSNLEDIMFYNATLFLPSVVKLLKKSSSHLRTLKFHRCKFILTTKSKTKNCKDPAVMIDKTIDKLWEGIQQQNNLTILEIVACRYTRYQTMSYDNNSSSTTSRDNNNEANFTFQLPIFLQEQKLPNLRRLVLDQCLLDSSQQTSFVKLLSNNTSLEELEIHPLFDVTTVTRRQQYQVKKRACREFLLETIPTTLSSNNNSTTVLRKLVVSIDDYLLDSIYGDALPHWVDLVKDDNHTLTELRATNLPLNKATKEADNIYGLKTDEWFHCNLQYNLRLNELMAAKRKEEGDTPATDASLLLPQQQKENIKINKKEFLEEILPEAYDVSCLHQLLQPNPDIMDASTQSVPFLCDFDDDDDDHIDHISSTRRTTTMSESARTSGSSRRSSCRGVKF